MAMRQLGGTTLVLEGASSQLGRGEPIADTARVLSRYVDAIMIRTDDHAKAEELADHATVPVINGLTDLSHPCQILADMQTVIEHRSSSPGASGRWVGDGNNVCNSLIEAAALMHFELAVATPDRVRARRDDGRAGEHPRRHLLRQRSARGGRRGAEVVVTDTWTSMGQEDEA